jgi:fructosamine-3-kinase
MGTIASRAETLLGLAVVATTPVAGGDICTATRVRLSDGSSALVKTRPNAPAGFFQTEARGLQWLGSTSGVDVPDVLAVTHQTGAPGFGADRDGFIGTLPLPNKAAPTWPEFFATRRVLPYLKLARDRGAVSASDVFDVESVVRRITELAGPDEPPARLHGDLWSGNVLWGQDGRTWVVDPAAYGGHRETDLAMLALFGLPQLQRVLDAYQEQTPLADGWEERVALHQLFPLLVHAALFGGGYGARAAESARSLL